MPTTHTDISFEQELTQLKETLLAMAGLCETMLSGLLTALEANDRDAARKLVDRDPEVDRMEKSIDNLCLRILARRQPVAADLRFITTAMKTVTDLERVGDLVSDIAWVLIDLRTDLSTNPTRCAELLALGRLVQALLREALDAFVAQDARRARELIPRDAEVNRENHRIQREVVEQLARGDVSADLAIAVLNVSRHLERVGDHAKNVAEQVIFLVEGQDVRHGP